MSRPRILFVDDDPQILQGLRNSLYRRRRDWEMVFAPDGETALAEFDKNPFDVVVSDMRMPSMDGATLLLKIRERYPDAIRIVLSGYAERESVLRTLPVSHQFLSKPCEGDRLSQVLSNGLTLRSILRNSDIRRLIGKLDRLPSAPEIFGRLVGAIENPTVASRAIAEIIESDPALSVKVLQLVNSAYFGLARETSSIVEAVTYLGVETMKMLALTARMFMMADDARVAGFSWDNLQQRAVLGARLAGRLIPDSLTRSSAFTAALLRDLGQIVLAITNPQVFSEAQRRLAAGDALRHQTEAAQLGFHHGQVGAYLLGLWGLPFPIVIAVAYCHTPAEMDATGGADVLATVHIADALIDEALSRDLQSPPESRLDPVFVEALGLSSRIPSWRQLAQEMVDGRVTAGTTAHGR
ncbi:MAG: response regulator [Candidatus Zixiibacteriota bacterium]